MRITLVTLGTRGDVQPYLALGLGLQRAGHEVRLATHGSYREFVTSHGLAFAPLPIDPQAMLAADDNPRWLLPAANTVRYVWKMVNETAPLVDQVLRDCLAACQDADVVISSVLGFLAAFHVAEKLEIPCVPAYFQPILRTREYPSMLAPLLPLGSFYNWLTYSLFDHSAWRFLRPLLNAGRQSALGLPPLPSRPFPMDWLWQQRQPHLMGFSETIVPKPPEWGDWVHVTGYWFLDRPPEWQPPPQLVAFLEAGPPPIAVGFGSITVRDPEEATALVLAALERAGQRGILLTGWGGLSQADLPAHVFKLEAIPHDWLFPRVAAVVHHGGAGTTAAGLRAGVPTIVIPNFMDQPFWGRRVAELGAGPSPIPRHKLTVERLAEAMQTAVHDRALRARAAALGDQLRVENGVERAVRVIEANPGRWLRLRSPRQPRPWDNRLRGARRTWGALVGSR
jgi:UDP:flavonoid glycosyltransferase YjiC (YdhE family)